jgi:hypothetical protein
MTSNDIIMDINEFDPSNVIFIKPFNFYQIENKIGIYYRTKGKDKKKIIIKTPIMEVPFGIGYYEEYKYYQMVLSLKTLTHMYNDDEIKIFRQFIRKIDKIIKTTVEQNIGNWGLPKEMKYRSSLKVGNPNYPPNMTFKLPKDTDGNFMFNIYGSGSELLTIDDITPRTNVAAVIELTHLEFSKSKKTYHLKWTMMQIKRYPDYSSNHTVLMNSCVFDDDPVMKNSIPVPLPSFTPTKYIPIPPPEKPAPKQEKIYRFDPPTANQLQLSLNSLRKTVTNPPKAIEEDIIKLPETDEPIKVTKKLVDVDDKEPVPKKKVGSKTTPLAKKKVIKKSVNNEPIMEKQVAKKVVKKQVDEPVIEKEAVAVKKKVIKKQVDEPITEKPVAKKVIKKQVDEPVMEKPVAKKAIKKQDDEPVMEKPVAKKAIKKQVDEPVIEKEAAVVKKKVVSKKPVKKKVVTKET